MKPSGDPASSIGGALFWLAICAMAYILSTGSFDGAQVARILGEATRYSLWIGGAIVAFLFWLAVKPKGRE